MEILNEIETYLVKVMKIAVSYGCHSNPVDLFEVISKKWAHEALQNLALYESHQRFQHCLSCEHVG